MLEIDRRVTGGQHSAGEMALGVATFYSERLRANHTAQLGLVELESV